MIRLTGFADEISPDLHEQIEVLHSEQIAFLELRSVWNKNVLDLNDDEIVTIKRTLDENTIKVSSIGSPIGKVAIDSPFEEHLPRFARALEVASYMETRYIRIFSFYPPATHEEGEGIQPPTYRTEVIDYLRFLTEKARATNLILLHENEKDIYGDTIERCVDLHQSIGDPHLRAIIDPANYLQCHQVPYPEAYQAIRPWLEYVHVKDVNAEGRLVVAGEGEAHWPELLQQLQADGYSGFLSLEPHLSAAGQYQGFSGPELFSKASQALKSLLHTLKWQYT